jgi:hypothetical protein
MTPPRANAPNPRAACVSRHHDAGDGVYKSGPSCENGAGGAAHALRGRGRSVGGAGGGRDEGKHAYPQT